MTPRPPPAATIALSCPASADDDGRRNERFAMSSAVQDLLAILDLERLELNLFRGRSPQVGWQRVFGGQVIGQALVAACRTVDVVGRPPHSLHAYFLLPATPRCRSSTRSTASATARASPRGAWSRSSMGRRFTPWRCRSTATSPA